jgi:hypothetical protein
VTFFVVVGTASDVIAVTIGIIVLLIVGLQAFRMWRGNPPEGGGRGVTSVHGTIAGFTTFVANAAGPVVNTYLVRLGLLKHEMVGTSAWLYFLVNVSKIPIYLTLGWLTAGGSFFTADALLFDLIVIPGVFVGVFGGRALFRVIPQRAFAIVVLALSALGALKLVVQT